MAEGLVSSESSPPVEATINPNHEVAPSDKQHQLAPWLPIPSRAISAVEHPCIVKNVDKGIASLGGPAKLSKGLRSRIDGANEGEEVDELKQLISVSLRPDDPFAKRLLSTAVTTNNLLLKVTVPKRTGRKRKRGSAEPFLTEEELGQSTETAKGTNPSTNKVRTDALTIFKGLQDNASTYKVSLAGVVDETHRFRTMPDLQYSAAHDDTMTGLRNHILPARYNDIKNYKIDKTPGANLAKSIGPAAEFMQMPIAFNYRFQQNLYVKYTEQGVVNLQRRLAYNSYTIIKPTDDIVPTEPKHNLPPESTLTPYLQTLIAQIRAEHKKRPVITRHLLYNRLGWDRRNRLRQAAIYCGYFFESGPWREALVQWGVDPRKDPVYRKYQTVSFLSYSKTGRARHGKAFDDHVQKLSQMSSKELETQHIFDGKNVSDTGNLFQFCDLTDPLLAKVVATEDIRTTCAPTFQGWYHVGTWAKITVILKDKMNTLIAGEPPDDDRYTRVVAWPELWDDQAILATYKGEVRDRQIHQEKKKEHDVMNNVRWAARSPRYAFEKMETADEQRQSPIEDEGEDLDDVEIPEDMTELPDTAAIILNEGEKDVDDQEDDEEDDDDEEFDTELVGDDLGEQGEDGEDEDDDSDAPVMSIPAVSEGPAPFGGLYRV
ncbi:transcription factor tfiiic complex a box associated subunit sfc1 [Phaeosphaeriaceae sp. SRC1lsM3a]|nr:transcription factor tfiiic complex a box associated subunit sfc1 [Stagonospora sp. SRC1lsM3a]